MRRYKDILAVREGANAPLAFHARNLQVAEISEEAWSGIGALSPVSMEAYKDLVEWNETENPQATSDRTEFKIRSLTLNVTQICNLHCTYCAAGGDGTFGDPIKKIAVEKTLPQIQFFLDQIPNGGTFHIAFLGGEPLLYPEAIGNIAEYTRDEAGKRGITATFKVTTNGTRVTDKALKMLMAIHAHVVVSLDGPAEINDLQRFDKRGHGSFDAAFEGLQKLLAHKDRLASVGVHSVFNEKNLDVEKSWDFFSPLPLDYLEFTYAVNNHDAEATRAYNSSLEKVLQKAFEKGGEDELLRINNVREIFARLDDQRRRTNHCGLGKSFVMIDARNQIWNCPWTVGLAGNKLGEGTDLDYDAIARHQASQIETNDCGTCWARFLCGGGCSFIHNSTDGDLKNKRNDFCERTRFLSALAVVYYHRSRAA